GRGGEFQGEIGKGQGPARTARLGGMVKAETPNGLAAATLPSPGGSGRSGWFPRSVSRSYTSLRAFPPAVKAAAAAPAHSNGWANSPHAPERTATRPPIPTPTADITQFPGRASRRRPAIPVRGTVWGVQIVAHSRYRE